jgi:UDP-2,3-diacylglucosamine pyrophosphatase LpxH
MFGEKTRTGRRMDEAFERALRVPFDIKRDRYVFFSDLHLADKLNGIDDFARNELIYCHALQKYFENDFHLVLNGDVEEGWEAKPRKIRQAYSDSVYAMEKKFADKGEPWHVRIWGNHDNIWSNPEKVRKHLWPELGKVSVYSGLQLGDNIFITHGHQGELLSDSGAWIGKPTMRVGWRWFQRLTRFTSARAATNHLIQNTRAENLYSWARNTGRLLIAGHTHKAMFGYMPEHNVLKKHLRRLENTLEDSEHPFQAQATIEHLRKAVTKSKSRRKAAVGENRLPCYFNGGSCVHTNGITGIEIDQGEIRLVRWRLVETSAESDALGNEDGLLFTIKPRVLQRANLAEVIAQIKLGSGRTSVPSEFIQQEEPEIKRKVHAAA